MRTTLSLRLKPQYISQGLSGTLCEIITKTRYPELYTIASKARDQPNSVINQLSRTTVSLTDTVHAKIYKVCEKTKCPSQRFIRALLEEKL